MIAVEETLPVGWFRFYQRQFCSRYPVEFGNGHRFTRPLNFDTQIHDLRISKRRTCLSIPFLDAATALPASSFRFTKSHFLWTPPIPKKRPLQNLIEINAVRIPNSCRNEADHREFCERTALDATLDFRQLRETEWPGRQSESRRSELIEVNCLGSFTEFGTLTRMSP